MKIWKTGKLKQLGQTLLAIKKEDDLLEFLRDLCTLDELEELSSRWQAAKLLSQGLPYREIAKKTKLSTTTVTRIAYWMENGEGGYKKALEKTKKHVS